MPSPSRAVASAGSWRPGAIRSTIRTATATRIAAISGEIVSRSWPLIGVSAPRRSRDEWARSLPEQKVDRRGAAEAVEDGRDRPVDQVQNEAREQSEDDHKRGERDERQRVDRPHVG